MSYYNYMYYDYSQDEDKDLKSVGLELMFMTPEKSRHDDGVSAVELSKSLGLPLEIVKKKLKILLDKNIRIPNTLCILT